MFTLKLYRRHPGNNAIQTKTIAVHQVITNEIGKKNENGQLVALELWAMQSDRSYETYFLGRPTEGMEACGKDDLHLKSGPNSWWDWGLLENSNGRTSEYYRPFSYG